MSDQITPIFPGSFEDFRWAGFGSGSGTNLEACAKLIKPSLIVCDRPKAGLLDLEELAGVPRIVENGYEFCGSWAKAQGDPEAEAEYQRKTDEFNAMLLEKIREFEQQSGIGIDLIVLGGYMRFVKDPLLSAFRDRIMNVHPSYLPYDPRSPNKRRFTGADAVYDAIKAGQVRTKSSVILVDDQEDHGEILT